MWLDAHVYNALISSVAIKIRIVVLEIHVFIFFILDAFKKGIAKPMGIRMWKRLKNLRDSSFFSQSTNHN